MGKNNGTTSWAAKQVFTTGEAAEVCNVSQQTIIRCFDSGRLQGFRVPGSRFRRIPRAELLRFMKSNEIPTDALESQTKRVLVVDDDEQIVELFEDLLGSDERFEIKTAATGYDAGLLTEQFKPHLILLDFMLPDINGNLVCERIKANPDLQDTKVLIISGVVSQDEMSKLTQSGADGFMKKPFDIEKLVMNMEELLQLA
ncbi:MAG: response regulator [Phycisphaerales bacterium]|nr:response regulator [Phycisphaerales bacterium]NNM27092.1 response regulator [Phycisphaerales bacterium]